MPSNCRIPDCNDPDCRSEDEIVSTRALLTETSREISSTMATIQDTKRELESLESLMSQSSAVMPAASRHKLDALKTRIEEQEIAMTEARRKLTENSNKLKYFER